MNGGENTVVKCAQAGRPVIAERLSLTTGFFPGNRLGESRLGTSGCRGSLASLEEKKTRKLEITSAIFIAERERERELSERAAALIFPASPVNAIADVNTASWTRMLLSLLEILFSILEGEAPRSAITGRPAHACTYVGNDINID